MPALQLEIYHVGGTRSERVIWLMEELGLDYELKCNHEDLGASLSAIAAIHKLRMSPTVRIGGEVLAESAYILEYILDRVGHHALVPARGSDEYWLYRQFMYFAEGTAAPVTISAWFDSFGWPSQLYQEDPDASTAATLERLTRLLAFLETHLQARTYITGNAFTAADIMMYLPFRQARVCLENVAQKAGAHKERRRFVEYPSIDAYYQRLLDRPAFVRTLAKANPSGARAGLEA